ncbi:hexosyltransferase [Plakobranchus ocellatus]|uniref:Hexosyltransferase n=1 Tax=Plakobranchus ocellatus TaxID=259542 RepID=A0AAV4ALH1_9GAST|nr:hexosyltransferase [Plakobranchus ocellatus]
MGRKRRIARSFGYNSALNRLFAALFIVLFVYVIVMIFLKTAQMSWKKESDLYHPHIRAREKKKSMTGPKVKTQVPEKLSRLAERGADVDAWSRLYTKSRLPPLSESSLLIPGSEEEIFTRKLLAIRYKKLISHYQYSFRYTIDPAMVCSQQRADVLVAATMPAHSKEGRHLFREHMWSGYGGFYNRAQGVVLLFFNGVPNGTNHQLALDKESRLYGDIVQASYRERPGDDVDSVKIVSALEWMTSRCQSAKYVIMATQTCQVNIPLMMTELQQKRPEGPLFILGRSAPLPPQLEYFIFHHVTDWREHKILFLARGCKGFPMSVARLLSEAAPRLPVQQPGDMLFSVSASLLNIPCLDNKAFYLGLK